MGQKRAINLQWPTAGLNRKYSFQHPAPYSCARALNVWSPNTWDRRQTGGSRAGTGKYSYTQMGSGNKVNLVSSVDWTSSAGGAQLWSDEFASTSASVDATLWTQVAAISSTNLTQSGGYAYVRNAFSGSWQAGTTTRGAAFKNLSINTSLAYTVSALVSFYKLPSGDSHKVRLYARMDATNPSPSSGVYAELVMESAGYSGALYVNGSSVGAFSGGTATSSERTGVFEMTISADTVTASWRGVAQLGAGVAIASHGSNVRTALGMTVVSVSSGSNRQSLLRIDNYGISNTSTTNVDVRTTIVAASNGQLYYDNSGTMTAVGSAVLDTSHFLQAVEYQQKLYIANYSITDAAQVPKIYDPSAGTVSTLTASAGTAPTRCALVARYSDRIVFARQYSNPHLWFMSRKGSPLDWDYTQLALGDNGSAISGQSSDASAIGKAITALCPFGDDYMVMGCLDELWVMRGDPTFGGQIDSLSRKVGILDKNTWCRTPEGGLLFLSKDGLYYVGPGAQMVPESISREKLPDELLNIDLLQTNVCMEYDSEFRGAWIFLHNIQAGQATTWFFDWENKAFWPMQYPLTQEVVRAYFVNTPTVRGVLLGCMDGYLRRHSTAFTNDDGTALGSYVEIGPIRLAGSEYDEGKLVEIVGTPHYGIGGTVTWTVKTAKNAQSLYNAVSGAIDTRTGTWTVGTDGSALNVKDRQRIRGGACVVRLEETDGAAWGIESVSCTIETAGKQRVSA